LLPIVSAHLIAALLTAGMNLEILELSLQDLADHGDAPSLWRICKIAVQGLRITVPGPVNLRTLLGAGERWHKLLADLKRQRRRQKFYPVAALS
jgi:hypothetical protein